MTLPNERSLAVVNARKFLLDLLDPKKTPKVPKAIRRQACNILRHYPNTFDLIRSAKKFKDIFDVSELEDE